MYHGFVCVPKHVCDEFGILINTDYVEFPFRKRCNVTHDYATKEGKALMNILDNMKKSTVNEFLENYINGFATVVI